MKYLILIPAFLFQIFAYGQTTIQDAQNEALESEKKILLVFTGSDWCKPCIQLKENILSTENFISFSENKIIQLDLDFPYKKKNKLSDEQTAHNEKLADTYNESGDFPKMVLIDSDLNYIETISYSSKMSTSDLIEEIKKSL